MIDRRRLFQMGIKGLGLLVLAAMLGLLVLAAMEIRPSAPVMAATPASVSEKFVDEVIDRQTVTAKLNIGMSDGIIVTREFYEEAVWNKKEMARLKEKVTSYQRTCDRLMRLFYKRSTTNLN